MRRLSNKRSIAKALLAIVKSGKHYNQGSWFSSVVFYESSFRNGGEIRRTFEKNVCGTTACVAGHAVVLTLPKNATYDWRQDQVILPDGSDVYVQTYAADVMGLSFTESEWLFDGNREVDDVIAALELLASGKSIAGLVNDYYGGDDSYDI
jgi:hypothetical protein